MKKRRNVSWLHLKNATFRTNPNKRWRVQQKRVSTSSSVTAQWLCNNSLFSVTSLWSENGKLFFIHKRTSPERQTKKLFVSDKSDAKCTDPICYSESKEIKRTSSSIIVVCNVLLLSSHWKMHFFLRANAKLNKISTAKIKTFRRRRD